MTDLWNKCDYCGRIIGYHEFESGEATHTMIIPESEVSQETFETHHIECKQQYARKVQEHQISLEEEEIIRRQDLI